ncbi:MAG: glutamine--fructose-6-phosphate transaminase (isomerizing) [Candidatus Aenigmarchaeota archaeon]|nr:glutamine--fructose-6-phosphate transaminase (isomerizing) [Candidatus Aenigmarchaeota archaeon]
MCGIFGYIGHEDAFDIIIDSLRRLEYRGYDSAGAATVHEGDISVTKDVGKISEMELERSEGTIGIGHTRWSTHGKPLVRNAHPISDCTGTFVVVHNGIIENFDELREDLETKGHEFSGETDTESFAHLLEELYSDGLLLEEVVFDALERVEGSYAFGILSETDPDKIVLARNGSPLVIGIGEEYDDGVEFYASSDEISLVPYTNRIIRMDDNEVCVLERSGPRFYNSLTRGRIEKSIETIAWSPEDMERRGYPHFVLKEIHGQPGAWRKTLREFPIRLDFQVSGFPHIYSIGAGTSGYAAEYFEYLFDRISGIPITSKSATEFMGLNSIVNGSLVVLFTQSGETKDVINAMDHAREFGVSYLSLTNKRGSIVERTSDYSLHMDAGPEFGVIGTKTFTSHCILSARLAIETARNIGVDVDDIDHELRRLPNYLETYLSGGLTDLDRVAGYLDAHDDVYVVGRGGGLITAKEGALKLKETTYIHAEALPVGDFKHGPLTLISEGTPLIVIVPQSEYRDKVLSNLHEVRARGGYVIAISYDGDSEIGRYSDDVIYLPKTHEYLQEILNVVPFQLLSYKLGVIRGIDPDHPRNIAKTVTVD